MIKSNKRKPVSTKKSKTKKNQGDFFSNQKTSRQEERNWERMKNMLKNTRKY